MTDPVTSQPFSFGDYLSAQAYWNSRLPVAEGRPQPAVIWLHPFSYNTGYTPTYMGAKAWSEIAAQGFVVMAYDQVGFGIRNTQGGNRFYARHGGNSSLLGAMVKDVRAAVDFLLCRSALRNNATVCSQHGYSTSNAGIDRIPYIDPDRIYVVGYAFFPFHAHAPTTQLLIVCISFRMLSYRVQIQSWWYGGTSRSRTR